MPDWNLESQATAVLADDLRGRGLTPPLAGKRVLEEPLLLGGLRRARLEDDDVAVQVSALVVILEKQEPIDLVLGNANAQVERERDRAARLTLSHIQKDVEENGTREGVRLPRRLHAVTGRGLRLL